MAIPFISSYHPKLSIGQLAAMNWQVFGEPLARAKKPYHKSILDSQERRMS
jgi:hypothetical protein